MLTRDELTLKKNRTSWINDQITDLKIRRIHDKLPENFEAIILSGIPEQNNSWKGTDASKASIAEKNDNRYYFVRVRPIGVQDLIIPDPFLANDMNTAKKLINAHPLAYIEVVNTVHPPTHGDVFLCRYTKKDKLGVALVKRLRNSNKKISGISNRNLHTVFNPDKNPQLMGNYGGNPGGGGSYPTDTLVLKDTSKRGEWTPGEHVIEKLEAGVVPSGNPVIGVGSPLAAQQAQQEIDWWAIDNRGETDAGKKGNNKKDHPVYRRIQLYKYYVKTRNDNVPVSDYFPNYENNEAVKKQNIAGDSSKGYGDGTTGIMHWSATSISWVMRGTGFPRSQGHSSYSRKIKNLKGSTGWEVHSLIRERVKIQLGDVLVRAAGHGVKGTSAKTASHGDVVYKISGGKAYLSGGNIGIKRGTYAGKKAGIPLDANGFATATGGYKIILKKMR